MIGIELTDLSSWSPSASTSTLLAIVLPVLNNIDTDGSLEVLTSIQVGINIAEESSRTTGADLLPILTSLVGEAFTISLVGSTITITETT